MKNFILLIIFFTFGLLSAFSQNSTVGIWYSTWYSNHGNYIWTEGHGVGSSNQFLGDMDGDGKDDAIVYFQGDGSWYVALSNGIAFPSYTRWIQGHGVGSVGQILKDFNGDGKDDALVRLSGGEVYVSTSNGNGLNGYSQWLSNFAVGSENVMADDVNGDGNCDLISYSSGTWKVALSNGVSFSAPITWTTGHGVGSSGQYMGDFNNDNKSDALVVFSSGSAYVSLSTGTSFGGYSNWGTLVGNEVLLIGDINQDSRDDVVMYATDGTWSVSYASSSSNSFGPVTAWKTEHTGNAENYFLGDPLGEGKEAAVAYNSGIWNILPNSNIYPKPLRWNLWDAWDIRYLPLNQGSYQKYDSGDPVVIQEHLAEITSAGIDYLLFDETNNIHVEGDMIFDRAQIVAQQIKSWNNDPTKQDIQYAYAVGGMQFTGDPNIFENEAKDVWELVVNNTMNGGPSTYFHLDGKPLLVCYYGQESYKTAWENISHPWTQYFTVRWANGTNASTPDLYGWGIPNGSINSSNLMEVMPGWNNHLGSFTSRTYNGIEGDFYVKQCWDRVLAQLPETVIINSYNEYAEQTAVATTNTNDLNAGDEKWSTANMYWNMTVNFIQQYRTGLKSVKESVKAKNETLDMVNSEQEGNRLVIYPNPSEGNFFMTFHKEGDYSYIIFDLNGRVIAKGQANFKQGEARNINLNNPKKGIYLIEISSNDYHKTRKLIVN